MKTMQSAFITGASSGIGKEMAFQYAKKGYRLFLTARREALLSELVSQINKESGSTVASYFPCDLKHHDQVEACVKEAIKFLGTIDLVICNAGMAGLVGVKDFSTDKIMELYNVNVFGVLKVVECFLPTLLQQKKGHIVAVASLAAYKSFAKIHPYCATKAALKSHMEGLAKELRPYGVSVTCLCPGFIKTDMTATNKKSMPFIMELDAATEKMIKAIERKKEVFPFPWQSYYGLSLMR